MNVVVDESDAPCRVVSFSCHAGCWRMMDGNCGRCVRWERKVCTFVHVSFSCTVGLIDCLPHPFHCS